MSVEPSRDTANAGAIAANILATAPTAEALPGRKHQAANRESTKKTSKDVNGSIRFKAEPAGDNGLHSVPAKLQQQSGSEPSSKTKAAGIKRAKDFFPAEPPLNDEINRALFQRLAECWDEQAENWTDEMRNSLWDQLGKSRVTRSTAVITTHLFHRNMITGATEPSWGSFVVLRELFGYSDCRRQRWWEKLVARYPAASEPPFYTGVVPKNYEDVFNGKVQYEIPDKVAVRCDEEQRKGKRTRYSTAVGYDSFKAEQPKDDEPTGATGKTESLSIKRPKLSSSEDLVDLSSLAPRDAISRLQARQKELNDEINSLKSKEESTLKMITWYEGQLDTMKGLQAKL